ncbi:hypothetical protein LTR78_010501 [Recurvomyces mirabilis]|uniref:Uncharacterized protein n=1 Tax=Recurvomyces mirabilis TaxID=574656 RepID=A0AAE0TPN2_9PEZI|nr:hypothetical protein LTR78_010501 [Recurvomyces mirabilis]KAK5151684.1 hypothetical protein LTS14_009171 [Recurvomyces mirabilis]
MDSDTWIAQASWNGVVDIDRAPSPNPRPSKRARQSTTFPEGQIADVDDVDQAWLQQELATSNWIEGDQDWLNLDINGNDYGEWVDDSTQLYTELSSENETWELSLSQIPTGALSSTRGKMMQTGCIPCLVKGIPCDPRNPACKRAMSDDWNLNYQDEDHESSSSTPESLALGAYRPDLTWRRNWRERHSLNFFVSFTAPQMAGFFDSTFWQKMVIQTSYHQPAILHAITAIGALHEAIIQRAFADEKRKSQAMEFALNQCNRAIASLTNAQARSGGQAPNSRIALTTCVLFTCFEAMQGRCDSAVSHALQGRRLLQAAGHGSLASTATSVDDDIEQMRPLVERLEVQATALLDKAKRPETDSDYTTLPQVDLIFSLDHAHNALHHALNSIMRFMQSFQPTGSSEELAQSKAKKYLRYAPWFQQWESAFTAFLADNRDFMVNMDFKRAMVLKANHLVGTMLASVDQSAGPVAYDPYETEFRAIVDLSREVLATFSCPPLPTLSGGAAGAPYLSFSLWVTDPLWMAISRCRNPSIRQAAFTLLSQNPRQEGIWHAGPQLSNNRYMRRVEANQSRLKETVKGKKPPANQPERSTYDDSDDEDDNAHNDNETNGRDKRTEVAEETHASTSREGTVREEWVDLRAAVRQATESTYLLTTISSKKQQG